MKPVKMLTTGIFTAMSICSANSFNVAIDGNFNSVLLKTNYSIGCTPMYNLRLKDKYDLCFNIPMQFVGKKTGVDNYSETIQYYSLGVNTSLYRTIVKNEWFGLSFGGDLFVNYGFTPSKITVSSGSKTKEKLKDVVIGNAGVGIPVVLDCTLNKFMMLRLTQRVIEFSADAHFNTKDYEEHLNFFAGFAPQLSPSMSLLFRF